MIRLKDGFDGERALVLPQLITQFMEKDPLLAALHITDIGYYPKASHHFRERTTPINQFVFIYCIDGAGWYRVNGYTYEVHENQYFILPAGMPHAYGADEGNPWTIYWMHFKGTLASCYAKNAAQPMEILPEKHSRINNRINLFEEIFLTLKSGYSNENLYYASSLFHHYLGSLRYVQQYRAAYGGRTDDEGLVDVTIHYMKENLEKRLTLQELTAQSGYSASHFSMLFKRKTGHSVLEYFNLMKIQEACFLLDSTDMKVNQICYKVGIDDAYYFSRLFNKIMGMSPYAYRKAKKG